MGDRAALPAALLATRPVLRLLARVGRGIAAEGGAGGAGGAAAAGTSSILSRFKVTILLLAADAACSSAAAADTPISMALIASAMSPCTPSPGVRHACAPHPSSNHSHALVPIGPSFDQLPHPAYRPEQSLSATAASNLSELGIAPFGSCPSRPMHPSAQHALCMPQQSRVTQQLAEPLSRRQGGLARQAEFH